MDAVHKVFISHASKNHALADDIRRRLEELELPCWIAPRDIPPGSSYGSEIVSAIESCLAVVVVLTDEANASRAVANELELAFRNQRVIIPVRLKPVQPASSLAFFVNNTQWVDAFHTPLKDRVPELARLLEAIRAGSAPPSPAPEKKTFVAKLERQIEGLIRYKLLTAIVAVSFLAVLGIASALMSGKSVSMLEAEQAKIAQDPASFGLVNLALADELVAGSNRLSLRATVYVNLADPVASGVKWKAYAKSSNSDTQIIDVKALESIRAAGAQMINFEVSGLSPAGTVVFCMIGKHPTLGSLHTAKWSFSIEPSAGAAPVISRASPPQLSPATPGDCS